METIRASSKGQIVIPKTIRDALDIRSGTKLNVELLPEEGFKVTVRTADHTAQVAKLAGSLAPRKKGRYAGLSDDDALLLAARGEDQRTRSSARRSRRERK